MRSVDIPGESVPPGYLFMFGKAFGPQAPGAIAHSQRHNYFEHVRGRILWPNREHELRAGLLP